MALWSMVNAQTLQMTRLTYSEMDGQGVAVHGQGPDVEVVD